MTGGPGTNGENQSPFVFCGGKAAHNKDKRREPAAPGKSCQCGEFVI